MQSLPLKIALDSFPVAVAEDLYRFFSGDFPMILRTDIESDAKAMVIVISYPELLKRHQPPLSLLQWRDVFRQILASEENALTLDGDWKLILSSRLLVKEAIPQANIDLTEREAKLLHCLLLSNGQVLSKEELLSDVWGYGAAAESHTLETHIYRLRQKLELAGNLSARLITTESGYRFNQK